MTLNITSASSVEGCADREKRFYASSEFGLQRKLLSSFVLTREKKDRREELWAGRVLLTFRCLVSGGTGGNGLAVVWYMKCGPSLDELVEPLKSACLHGASSSSGKESNNMRRESGKEPGVAGEWLE